MELRQRWIWRWADGDVPQRAANLRGLSEGELFRPVPLLLMLTHAASRRRELVTEPAQHGPTIGRVWRGQFASLGCFSLSVAAFAALVGIPVVGHALRRVDNRALCQ